MQRRKGEELLSSPSTSTHFDTFFRRRTTKRQMASAVAASIPPHLTVREPKQQCVENLILVWYDPDLSSDEDERQARKTISELQHIVNWNQLLNDHKTCVEFLNQLIKDQHVLFCRVIINFD